MKGTLRHLIQNLEEYVTLFFFFVMCLFVGIQIVTRYVMNNPLSFSDEIARYAYVWMTFIGLALATKHDVHVRVDLTNHFLKRRVRKILSIFIHAGMVVLLGIMFVLGWEYSRFSSVNRWASLPMLSMFLVTVSFPIGCFIALMRTIGLVRKEWASLKKEGA